MNAQTFTQSTFMQRLPKIALKAGKELIRSALILCLVWQRSDVPLWAKTTIVNALLYLLSPIDAIPDYLPMGFMDDAGVLAAALLMVASYIDEAIKAKADAHIKRWFGE